MTGDVNKLCMNCMQYTLGEDGVCVACGHDSKNAVTLPHHLMERTVLNGKYLSARVLGEGGFGITYLGWDINLEIKVAIKEYYPLGAVTRNTTVGDHVTALAGNTEELFSQGRERFIDEARRLAKFYNLPGIVSVKDFFLENGTAYIVMEFVEGVTLKDYLEECGGRMDEATVLELMKPLMKSLAEVHKAGVIHRDISPDNIMLTPDGQLRLIDFGAARDFNDENKSLSVLLKPGYAPEEQYRSRGKQGPWTDVYALSATIFRAIEGDKPPESMERMYEDDFKGFTVPVSAATNEALMKGLAVRATDRWQSLDELYTALYGVSVEPASPIMPLPVVLAAQPAVQAAESQAGSVSQQSVSQQPAPAAVPVAPKPPEPKKEKTPEEKKKRNIFIAVASVVAVLLLALALVLTQQPPPVEPQDPVDEPPPVVEDPVVPPEPIVIGASLPLSGNSASVGTEISRGIEYAVDLINASGGINGRMVDFIAMDDIGDAQAAVMNLYELVETHDITAMISCFAATTEALALPAQEAGIPIIATNAYGETLSVPGTNVFQLSASSIQLADALASFAADILGARESISMTDPEFDHIVRQVETYEERAHSKGMETVGQLEYSLIDADADRIREEIYVMFESTYFAAVCNFGNYTITDVLAETSAALGNAFAVLSPGSLFTVDRAIQAGEYSFYENSFYATRYVPDASDRMAVFSETYLAQYGEAINDYAVAGLEAMYILEQAILATESAQPAEILEVLRTHDFALVGDGAIHFKDTGEAVREVYIANAGNGAPRYYMVDPQMNVGGYVPGRSAPADDAAEAGEQIAVYYIGFQYTSAEEHEMAYQKLDELLMIFDEYGIDRHDAGEMGMEFFIKYASEPYYNDGADTFVAGQPMIFDRNSIVAEFYDAAAQLGDYEISDIVDADGICGIVMRVPY